MTRLFDAAHTEEVKIDAYPLQIKDRDKMRYEFIFVDGFCRQCGYATDEHRLVLPGELTTEWKICATERMHGFTRILTRYICISKEGRDEYMSRDEFEELYDES